MLHNPAIWSDSAKATALQKEHDQLEAELPKLTAEWEAKASDEAVAA